MNAKSEKVAEYIESKIKRIAADAKWDREQLIARLGREDWLMVEGLDNAGRTVTSDIVARNLSAVLPAEAETFEIADWVREIEQVKAYNEKRLLGGYDIPDSMGGYQAAGRLALIKAQGEIVKLCSEWLDALRGADNE